MEKAILIGVQTYTSHSFEERMEEMKELALACDIEICMSISQNLEHPHKKYYMNPGKIEEVKRILEDQECGMVLVLEAISPSVQRNLSDFFDCEVMDKSALILEIFASRAKTKESMLQVECARLKYLLPRLQGSYKHMDRQRGGSRNKGTGEKKIELDARRIEGKIHFVEKELDKIHTQRSVQRNQRKKGMVKSVALTGYTNAGKSTLLNTLTGAGVLSEDKLFATLDPTTRALTLDDGQQILLTDTVGFIRKLPHNLVEAFKSTLEEAKYADYIIHVVDCSNPQAVQQMEVVYDTLQELGVQGKKTITLFNKVDVGAAIRMRDSMADHTLKVSAKTGEGLEDLKQLLGKILSEEQIYVEKIFSYQEAGKIQLIREYGQLLSEEYTDTGILVKARVPQEIHGKLM